MEALQPTEKTRGRSVGLSTPRAWSIAVDAAIRGQPPKVGARYTRRAPRGQIVRARPVWSRSGGQEAVCGNLSTVRPVRSCGPATRYMPLGRSPLGPRARGPAALHLADHATARPRSRHWLAGVWRVCMEGGDGVSHLRLGLSPPVMTHLWAWSSPSFTRCPLHAAPQLAARQSRHPPPSPRSPWAARQRPAFWGRDGATSLKVPAAPRPVHQRGPATRALRPCPCHDSAQRITRRPNAVRISPRQKVARKRGMRCCRTLTNGV